MAVKVVDSSAVIAILFAEPDAEAVARQLKDFELAAPALLTFELGNVCATKMKRSPGDRPALMRALSGHSDLQVAEHAVDLDEVVVLAGQTGLTGYDASYLWLARHFGAELVTLDRQLGRAYAAMAA